MFTPLSGLEGAAVPALTAPLGPAAAMGAMILGLFALSTLVLLLAGRRAPRPYARSRTPSTPTFPAQLAQQDLPPLASTPCQPQRAQISATAWVAHAKLSESCRLVWATTSKAWS